MWENMPQEANRQTILFQLRMQDEVRELMGERLEMLEDEIFCLRQAVEYLGRVRGCDDVISELEDKMKVLGVERESAAREEQQVHTMEMEALTREYYAGLM